MTTGKRLRLTSATLAIESVSNTPLVMQVPMDTVVEIIDDPSLPSSMVRVAYDGRIAIMFTRDIKKRGTELPDS